MVAVFCHITARTVVDSSKRAVDQRSGSIARLFDDRGIIQKGLRRYSTKQFLKDRIQLLSDRKMFGSNFSGLKFRSAKKSTPLSKSTSDTSIAVVAAPAAPISHPVRSVVEIRAAPYRLPLSGMCFLHFVVFFFIILSQELD